MNEQLFAQLGKVLSADRIRKDTEEIHRLEGNESNSNFKASTDYIMKMMEDAGFRQVERIALPADGKTRYFDCVMPLAWDSFGRSFVRLEDESLSIDDRLIADTARDPFAAGVWGAPTPEGGLTCEVADYRQTGADPEAIRGKLVLMDGFSQVQYRYISEHGGAGVIISDSKAGDDYPDFGRWSNAIGFTGWYHVAEDPRIPVFLITPRRAEFLRKRLAAGPVKAHAEAQTRIYEGEFYTVTGVIPGESEEEITMVAHMYEPFLADDAAGGAIICELCRGIRTLIEQGVLPPLKRTLRIVLSLERFGFSQYFMDRERNRRTLTVVNFDSCCHFSGGKDRPRLKLRLSSMVRPSFLDLCLPELFRKDLPEVNFIIERGNLSDDTFTADDWIGIPSLWLHSANTKRYHHNLGPMFMAADWDLAFTVAHAMGTLIGTLATADAEDFRVIAEETLLLAKAELAERIAVTQYELKLDRIDRREAADKIRFLAEKAAGQLASIDRYAPGTVTQKQKDELAALAGPAIRAAGGSDGEPELHGAMAQAAKIVPERLEPGTLMSMIKVPAGKRHAVRIPDLLYILLDGKRSLYEAMKLYEYEMDTVFSEADYVARIRDLEYLEQYGYVKIGRR
ncbi:MAG: hypothetical protein IJS14_00865 [Lentisphaeria bacterium]|nr:hypothetical protein [Lentisphaeria bacterium]